MKELILFCPSKWVLNNVQTENRAFTQYNQKGKQRKKKKAWPDLAGKDSVDQEKK